MLLSIGTDNTIDKICMDFKDLGKIVEQDQLLEKKKGGFGQLYRRKRENGFTAVKKVSQPLSQIRITEGFTVENAFHEARVHSMLVHQNIPKYYNHYFNAEENVLEIEMEYFEGFNLQGVTSVKNHGHGLLYLAKQIIKTLEYIHSRGIIHFDLSLSNILVNSQRQIKIVDFGSALFRSDFQPGQKFPSCISLRTAPFFSTPENIKLKMRVTKFKKPSDFLLNMISKAVNFSADVYSFGVCFYYLAVGAYPFKGQTKAQISQNILTKSIDFDLLSTPWLKNLLRNLLNKNPQKRYTISQIIDYLQKVAIQECESCAKKIKIL